MWVCDLGNTRIHWGWYERGTLSKQGSAAHERMRCGDFWQPAGKRVVVVSVADDAIEHRLRDWLRSHGVAKPRFLHSQRHAHGVTNAYKDVSQMGADRWAAMVGARNRHEGPLVVMDCGSAITVDVLDAAGLHLGGAILPGLKMMSDALTGTTARIAVGDDGGAHELGAATAECVSAGILAAAAGGIRHVLNAATNRLGREPTRVLCGGDAPRLRAHLEPVIVDPDLVLWGAVLLAGGHIHRE